VSVFGSVIADPFREAASLIRRPSPAGLIARHTVCSRRVIPLDGTARRHRYTGR
jgi:hypothetical protein